MKRRRRGFTLLEAAIVVSMLSVVIVMATATLTTLYRLERQFAGDAAQNLALNRLASQFRADCHAATVAQVTDGCQLSLPGDQTVQYAFTSPAITRELRSGDQVEQREAYVLPRGARAAFAAALLKPGQLVKVQITSPSEVQSSRSTPIREATIEAAVNLPRRQPAAGGAP